MTAPITRAAVARTSALMYRTRDGQGEVLAGREQRLIRAEELLCFQWLSALQLQHLDGEFALTTTYGDTFFVGAQDGSRHLRSGCGQQWTGLPDSDALPVEFAVTHRERVERPNFMIQHRGAVPPVNLCFGLENFIRVIGVLIVLRSAVPLMAFDSG